MKRTGYSFEYFSEYNVFLFYSKVHFFVFIIHVVTLSPCHDRL